MLEQMKAKAKEGAHKAEVAAKCTKIKADVMLLENKKKTLLMEFGKDVYPAMAAGDRATTETLFMTTKSKVEALEAEMVHKKEEIERLKHSDVTAGVAGMSVGPPPGGAVGPPPGGPPPAGGEPQLPPGWKSAPPPRPWAGRPRSPPAAIAATAASAAALLALSSLLTTHRPPQSLPSPRPLRHICPPPPDPHRLTLSRVRHPCPAEAMTPEGKEYYYDANGATSWTFPTA